MSEHISEDLKPHSQTLAHMFTVGCQDAVTGVVIEALSSTGTYIMQLGDSPEVMVMKNVISPMLAAMGKCMRDGDEDIVVEGLDVIQQCCELEQPLINDHIEVRGRYCHCHRRGFVNCFLSINRKLSNLLCT